MKIFTPLLLLLMLLAACNKKQVPVDQYPDKTANCDIQAILVQNSSKVTVTNGVWGTISIIQGDCMPIVGPHVSTCTRCPLQREVRIYAYTMLANATRSSTNGALYDSFNTQLIKTVKTDADGFYQTDLPDGKYTVVFVEDGKLYASGLDGQGGISPVIIQQNKVNIDLMLSRASF